MADLRKRNVRFTTAEKSSAQFTEDPDIDPDAGWNWAFRFWVFCKVALTLVVAPCMLLVFLDSILTSPIEPEYFKLDEPPLWEEAMTPNTILSTAEKLALNQVLGPESFAFRNGKLYTGTADGKVVSVTPEGTVKIIAEFGRPPCGSFDDEPTCGRPLGLRFDTNGKLVVIDAYLGLYSLDVDTGKFQQLFPASMPIEGKAARLMNDLDISSSGDIYITDSSWKWDRRHHKLLIFENAPHGRVIRYSPSTNSTSVLLGDLYFPNGIQLSPEQDYFLFVETTMCRVMKYNLKGPSVHKVEVFVDNLPGMVDNIRPSSSGGYWLALAAVRPPHGFSGYDALASRPYIRRFLAKILDLEALFKFVDNPYGMIIELDSNGKIVRSLQDPTGKTVGAVSEVVDTGKTLYMGSYHAPYIAKLPLSTTSKSTS